MRINNFALILSLLLSPLGVPGPAIAATYEEACHYELYQQSWSIDVAEKYCKASRSHARFVVDQAMGPCVSSAKALVASNKYPRTLSVLCQNSDMKERTMKDLEPSCLKSYLSFLSEDFLALDEIAREQRTISSYHSIGADIVRNCLKGPLSVSNSSQSEVKVVGRTLFHTLETIDSQTALLGGLSGMARVNKNTYVTVSDDRVLPRVTYFNLAAQPNSPNQFKFQQLDTTILKGNYLDLEDLQIFSIDRDRVAQFIFTSEEIYTKAGFASLSNKTTEAPPQELSFCYQFTG